MDLEKEKEMCLKKGLEFPFMPLSNSNEIHKSIKDSVTFFGGSFNPFHDGHLACLNLCPEKNIVLVLDCNPQKETRNFSPYEEYLKLKEILKDTRYYIYPAFWGIEEKNPTSSWLPLVKIKEKNLLVGDDSYMKILTWVNPENLLKSLAKLFVVPRLSSIEEMLIQKEKLLKINPNLEIIFLADHPYKDLSSTKLR